MKPPTLPDTHQTIRKITDLHEKLNERYADYKTATNLYTGEFRQEWALLNIKLTIAKEIYEKIIESINTQNEKERKE